MWQKPRATQPNARNSGAWTLLDALSTKDRLIAAPPADNRSQCVPWEESTMSDKIYNVPAEWTSRAFIDNEKYLAMYKRSVEDPNGF